MTTQAIWRWLTWDQMDPDTLYAFLKLRSDVFVVEQRCLFSDMDGIDARCEHLCGWHGVRLVAYLRLVPPELKSREPGLGRLVVAPPLRGTGLAREAILRGLERAHARYPELPVYGQAQAHLRSFYESLGFKAIGPEYEEDGIAHVDMLHRK